jgi:hypothetical protein
MNSIISDSTMEDNDAASFVTIISMSSIWIVSVLILVVTGTFFFTLSTYLEKDLFDVRQEEIASITFVYNGLKAEHY